MSDNDKPMAANATPVISKDNTSETLEEQLIRDDVDPDTIPRDGMMKFHVNAYSVGHYFNDLCACMWFFYVTWYLINIVGLKADVAGYALLSG